MKFPIQSQNRRGVRGSAVVESSLAFIVFACLLLGAFDFGQFLFIHQALTERARYAARWGVANDPATTCATTVSPAPNPISCDQVKNMVLYDSTTTGSSPYFNMSTSCATNTSTSLPTSGVCAQYWDAGTDNARVIVTIIGYQYLVLSPYIAGTYTSPNIEVTVPVGRFD